MDSKIWITGKRASVALAMGLGLLATGCFGGDKEPKPHKVHQPHLTGMLKASTYTSSEGGFSVPVPVSVELDGRVLTDGPQTVTFTDNWGSRITFTSQSILPTSAMAMMLESKGREKALLEFASREYGDMIEPHYHSEEREGLLSFIYLRPASPNRGVAIFVHNSRLYLVETDMQPGANILGLKNQASLEDVAIRLAESVTTN